MKRPTRENEVLAILADILGEELLREICRRLGGTPIYLPREPRRIERNLRIKRRYGRLLETTHPLVMSNIYSVLRREFHLSETQLRRILSE